MTPRIDFSTLDLRAALDFAIGNEEDSELRYQEYSAVVTDPGTAELFRQMAASESQHRRPETTACEAMELALCAEVGSYAFYQAVIPQLVDPDVRLLFEELKEEEAEHEATLRRMIEARCSRPAARPRAKGAV